MKINSLRCLAAVAAISIAGLSANALTLKSVTPENNSVVEKIGTSEIKLEFDANPDLVNWGYEAQTVYVTDDKGIKYKGYMNTLQDWSAGMPPKVFITISLDADIEADGIYSLILPAGTFCEDGVYANINEEIKLRWTIGEAGPTFFAPSLIMPENNSTVETIGKSDIFVWFPGNVALTNAAYDNEELNHVVVKDAAGKVVATSEILNESYVIPQDKTYFNITLDKAITEDGTYTITIPKGIIAPWDETDPSNEEVVLTYTVVNPANDNSALKLLKVQPANGAKLEGIRTDDIKLFFNMNPWFSNYSYYPGNILPLVKEDGTEIQLKGFVGIMGATDQVQFTSDAEILAPGTYTLTIPAGYICADDNNELVNEEPIVLSWTIIDTSVDPSLENIDLSVKFLSSYPAANAEYNFSTEGGAFDFMNINWEKDGSSFTADAYNPNVKPYIEDANGNRTMSTSVMMNGGASRINFNSEETKLWKTGDYTLVIPANFIGDSNWKASKYTEGSSNPEQTVNFSYVQDPNLDDVNNDFALELSKFGWYQGDKCLVDYLTKPETCPNIKGSSTTKLVIGSNKNDMSMDVYVEVFDVTDGARDWMWGAGTYRQQVTSVDDVRTINGKNADGEFEVEFSNSNFTLEFLKGHEYTVEVGFYKQYDGIPEAQRICYDTAVARFSGNTLGYQYADCEILSVVPDEGAQFVDPDNASIVITFSKPVTMDTSSTALTGTRVQTNAAYQSMTSNEDGTVWTLKAAPSQVNISEGGIDFRFAPRCDGQAFKSDKYYTAGEKAQTYIELSYYCFLSGAEITADPADGAEVEELYDFTFKVAGKSGSAANIGFQGVSPSGQLLHGELKDADGNLVTSLDIRTAEIKATESGEYNIDCQMHLVEKVTAPGTYTLSIPGGFFMTGTESTSKANKPMEFTYTIKGQPVVDENVLNVKEVLPSTGVVEKIPSQVQVFFDKDCDLNWDEVECPFDVYLVDQNGVTIQSATVRGVAGGWGSPIYLPIYFNADVEAAGTYTLTIPAGYIIEDGNPEVKNKEVKLVWTIEGGEISGDLNLDYSLELSSTYPADGYTYDYNYEGGAVDKFLVNWNGTASVNPNVKAYIEDAEGNRTMSTMTSDFSGSTLLMFNTEETKLWKTGAYTLVIPANIAGSVDWKASGYTEGVCNPEIKINFNYVQDPNLDDVNNDFALELSKFAWYNGETCLVNYLDNPETSPNIKGGETTKLVIGSNKNEMSMDVYVEVFDVTDGAREWMWGAGTYRQAVTSVDDVRTINGKNADGEFEVEFSNPNFTLEFLKDHEYTVEVGFYKQYDGIPEAQRICYDTAIARFQGTTEGYQYSDCQILSVVPEEGAQFVDANDATMTVTFSKPVTIAYQDKPAMTGTTAAGRTLYESITSNEDGTVWTFKAAPSAVNASEGSIDFRFAPRCDGQAFRSDKYYTSGEKGTTYITVSYYCFLNGAELAATPADGSEVEALYDFTFKVAGKSGSAANIGFQGVSPSGKLINGELKDADGNVVATLDRNDIKATESGEYNLDAQMHLDQAITAPGTYTLTIPGGLFMTGTESASVANKPMTFTYTIKGEPIVIEPETDYVKLKFYVGGYAGIGYKTLKEHDLEVEIESEDFWALDTLELDGEDVSDAVVDGKFTIPAAELKTNATLVANFKFTKEIDFDFSTGVEEIVGCDYKVLTDDEKISIGGLTKGDTVRVFSLNGMLLAEQTATNIYMTINLPTGVYIVMINNTALKIAK